MANLTDNRLHAMIDGIGMASLPVAALASTTWYRGAAVGVTLDSATAANIGYATGTLDGTIPAIFAGVMKRKIVVPASTDAAYATKRQLPLKRDGAVVFNAVTTAGNAATPDASWLWKKVFFVTDNEVSLTPPSQAYPLYAGRVIGINGGLGMGLVGSTEVLVSIAEAVDNTPCPWSYLVVNASTVINASTVDVFRSTAIGHRWFVRRAIITVNTVPSTGTLTCGTLIDPAAGGSPTLTGFGGAATSVTITGAGYVTTRAINAIVSPRDAISIQLTTSGNSTAGAVTIALEYMPLL